MQTTLTRIFIVLESKSHSLSEKWDEISRKARKFTENETHFLAKIGYSNAFSDRITTSTSQLRHPISFGGGCFQFFTKNWPQKHQKRAILHTSQANGGGSSPPPPPPLATLLIAMVVFCVLDATFYSLIQSNVTSR